MKASIYCIFALFVINANASPWAHRLLRSDDDKEQMIVDAPSAIVDGPSAYSSVVLQRDEKRSDALERDEKRSYFLLRDDKRSDVQQRDEKRSDGKFLFFYPKLILFNYQSNKNDYLCLVIMKKFTSFS